MINEENMTSTLEEETGKLFGGLWTSLSDQQYRESVELFTKRAVANKFDLDWLKGKKCLDAGCGSGRYSVALAIHGAGSVTAVDVSVSGLAEASRRASEFSSIAFQQASVLDLPFEDNSFDFVWSAGVIHHTSDFDRALSELTRVLKPQGKLFLLVYGAGGLRWKAVQALRPVVVDLGMKFIDDAIGIAGLPANNRKHFMDDLFVPIQKLTRFSELTSKLPNLGYGSIDRWTGETFDHESNPIAQLEDIKKLERITHASLGLAETEPQRYLTRLAHATAQMYVDVAERALADKTLSDTNLREIVIGEGNHRIVATKF
ncbi:MAG: class I SAM-dependent methyltransferase [Polaromonas sp.]|nr:class I SAM-dependent methyltransferase [Polaromonas sp.]